MAVVLLSVLAGTVYLVAGSLTLVVVCEIEPKIPRWARVAVLLLWPVGMLIVVLGVAGVLTAVLLALAWESIVYATHGERRI